MSSWWEQPIVSMVDVRCHRGDRFLQDLDPLQRFAQSRHRRLAFCVPGKRPLRRPPGLPERQHEETTRAGGKNEGKHAGSLREGGEESARGLALLQRAGDSDELLG